MLGVDGVVVVPFFGLDPAFPGGNELENASTCVEGALGIRRVYLLGGLRSTFRALYVDDSLAVTCQ